MKFCHPKFVFCSFSYNSTISSISCFRCSSRWSSIILIFFSICLNYSCFCFTLCRNFAHCYKIVFSCCSCWTDNFLSFFFGLFQCFLVLAFQSVVAYFVRKKCVKASFFIICLDHHSVFWWNENTVITSQIHHKQRLYGQKKLALHFKYFRCSQKCYRSNWNASNMIVLETTKKSTSRVCLNITYGRCYKVDFRYSSRNL